MRQIERLPNSPPDDLGIPDALLVFTDIVLAIDNLKGRAMAIAAVPIEHGMTEVELRSVYDDAAERTAAVIRRLSEAQPPEPLELEAEPESDPPFTSSSTRAEFEAGVERIREYIRAGDAFQVVLSQRLGMNLRRVRSICTGRFDRSIRRRISSSWRWTGSRLLVRHQRSW